jgi:hypothetical protein
VTLHFGQVAALWRGLGVGSLWTRLCCGWVAWFFALGFVYVLLSGPDAIPGWLVVVMIGAGVFYIAVGVCLWFSRSVRLYFEEPVNVQPIPLP